MNDVTKRGWQVSRESGAIQSAVQGWGGCWLDVASKYNIIVLLLIYDTLRLILQCRIMIIVFDYVDFSMVFSEK